MTTGTCFDYLDPRRHPLPAVTPDTFSDCLAMLKAGDLDALERKLQQAQESVTADWKARDPFSSPIKREAAEW